MPDDIAYGIAGAASYLPPQRRHVRDWAQAVGPGAMKLLPEMERNGLENYHVAEQLTVTGLAQQAVARLIETISLKPAEVDAVLYCHSSPTSTMCAPFSVPTALIRRFGMTCAAGMSISQQKCTSVIGTLRLARSLFWKNPALQNLFVVSADKTLGEQWRNLGTYAISSDGALALWIRRGQEQNRIGTVVYKADPAYYRGVEKGPELQKRFSINYPLVAYGIIQEILRTSRWTSDQLGAILPMNMNVNVLAKIAEMVGIPRERMYTRNIAGVGHVACSDPFLNFMSWLRESHPRIREGKVILYASGSSGAFAGMSIENADATALAIAS